MTRAAGTRKRAAHQLPAGRHGLSRDYVAQNQRERILTAVGETLHGTGYAALTVEDIISVAGVSRRTFYDHFRSKDEAFLAAYDAHATALHERARAAFGAHEGFVDRVSAGLEAVLDFFATTPHAAHICIVEVLAAGPAALERRAAMVRSFAALLDEAASALPRRRQPPALTAETLVGGIYEVIYTRAVSDRLDELPGLAPDLLLSVLLPYVGQEEAAGARRSAKARVRRRAA